MDVEEEWKTMLNIDVEEDHVEYLEGMTSWPRRSIFIVLNTTTGNSTMSFNMSFAEPMCKGLVTKKVSGLSMTTCHPR